MLKKLIIWLVAKYNKKATVKDQIEVVKPETFSASITSGINPNVKERDKSFMQNIINEKKYDLRQELIKGIQNENCIKETVELREEEIFIKLELKVFDYGKR